MTGLKYGILFLALSPLLGCANQMVGWQLNERPTVDNTLPAYGATDVGLGTLIIAEFSEHMDPLTINGDTFYVRHGATPVAGDITYEGVTATFTPDEPLMTHTVYTVHVDQDASDLSGLGMAEDVGWSFTTGRLFDDIGPTVLLVAPAPDSTNAPIDTTLAATFSEVMHPLTINTSTYFLVGPTGRVTGEVTQYGTSAWFDPDVDLLLDTEYTATITDQAQDLSGNALPGDYVWTFRTSTTLPAGYPYVVLTDPDDEDVDVVLDTFVSATFSEPMHPLTINEDTFLLYDGPVAIDGIVTQIGVTAWFDPDFDLDPDTEYTAIITDEAQDLDGHAIAADYTWTFTTGLETTAPEVIDTVPDDRAIDVDVITNVTATFSEAMDPLTIDEDSFVVTGPLLSPVDGVVTYDALTMTATFDPVTDLEPDTQYLATVTMTAADLAGNTMVEDYLWSFTTAGGFTPFDPPPVDLGSLTTWVAISYSGITNSAVTYLGGNVGISPAGACVACAPPDMYILGELYNGGAIAAVAMDDLTDAFIEAMAYPPATAAPYLITADLGDQQPLAPGVYSSGSTMNLKPNGVLVLDAQGDPNAWWVFQVPSALTVQEGSRVIIINEGRAANVFWAVGSSATLLQNVYFQGTVLAGVSLSIGSNTSVNGRLLCSTGAITLLSDTVTLPLP